MKDKCASARTHTRAQRERERERERERDFPPVRYLDSKCERSGVSHCDAHSCIPVRITTPTDSKLARREERRKNSAGLAQRQGNWLNAATIPGATPTVIVTLVLGF